MFVKKILFMIYGFFSLVSTSLLRGFETDYIPLYENETTFISYDNEGIRTDLQYKNDKFTIIDEVKGTN